MAWKKKEHPRYNTVTFKLSDEELAQCKELMKSAKISLSEAARRLSFGGEA